MITLDYNAPIIPNGSFTWREYATMRGTGELAKPTQVQHDNAVFLFTKIQVEIRTPLKRPLTISSGARTPEYVEYLRKQGIPAARHGAHNDWAAVDLRTPHGMSNAEFWAFCDKRWPGRLENLAYTPGWVHLDTRQYGKRIRFNP